jgi:cytochrome c5
MEPRFPFTRERAPMSTCTRRPFMAIAVAMLLAIGSGALLDGTAAAQAPATAPPASQAAQSPQAAPAGNAAAGRKTFIKTGCNSCHANEAQGAAPTGPRLAPNPIPFAAFARYVRAPRANMPPYGEKVLSDQDLADIHAFLRGQPGPAKVDSLLPPS